MRKYAVGYIYTRCFIQKECTLPDGTIIAPLSATGSTGAIHDTRKKLMEAHFPYSRKDLEKTLENHSRTGPSVLIRFFQVFANSYIDAIESLAENADNIAGSLCVISASAAIPLCAFATNQSDSGLKFFIPHDRLILHGTNIPGYLDALPDLCSTAQNNPKISLLLRLFRASMREREIDHQILFLLILLEEASDDEQGSLAQKIRAYAERLGFFGDLATIASQCGVVLPEGKDVVDLVVKLRNAAAHNGNLSEATLREYKGEWAIPIVNDKDKLHNLLVETIRYMFCCLAGHNRDKMAVEITGPFEIRFD